MAYKLVIAVRTDLGMSIGKTAAQVAHAAVTAALTAAGTPQLPAWLGDGQGKVVVRVDSLEALQASVAAAQARDVRVSVIADAGRTELQPGTETCAAFGPDTAENLAPVTGQLPLL